MAGLTMDQHRFVICEDSDNEMVVIFNRTGGLYVTVAEEKAVDSYNDTFTCGIALTREEALKLRDWITEGLASPSPHKD